MATNLDDWERVTPSTIDNVSQTAIDDGWERLPTQVQGVDVNKETKAKQKSQRQEARVEQATRQYLAKRTGVGRNQNAKAYIKNMRWLQDKYGDPSTDITRNKGKLLKYLPTNQPLWDEEELMKRYAQDKWGTDIPPMDKVSIDELATPPGIPNIPLPFDVPVPSGFVDLGRTLKDVPYALKQTPELFNFGSMNTKEQEKDKAQRDLIWAAQPPSIGTQLQGFGLSMLPSLGSSAAAPAMLGKLTGNQTLKGLGHNIAARNIPFRSTPKTAAGLGAAEAFLGIPHEEGTGAENAWIDRLTNAGPAAAFNWGATHATRGVADMMNLSHIRGIEKARQAPLGKRGWFNKSGDQIREHGYDTLGDPVAKARAQELIGKKGNRLYDAEATYKKDFDNAVDRFALETTGKEKARPLGRAMEDIFDQYLTVFNQSKSRMNAAYKKIPDDTKLTVTNKGEFNTWRNDLHKELRDNSFKVDKTVNQVLNELDKIGKHRGKGRQTIADRSIRFQDIRTFMQKLNAEIDNVGSDPNKRAQYAALIKIKSGFDGYIDDALFRQSGQRGGVPGEAHPGIQAWKDARAQAKEHYTTFHGNEVLDEVLHNYSKARSAAIRAGKQNLHQEGLNATIRKKYKREDGKKSVYPVDVAEDMFVGKTNKFDKRTEPRVDLVNRFRTALRGFPDFDVDKLLREEALNTLRMGGVKGPRDTHTLVSSVRDHVLPGQHRDLFGPKDGKTLFGGREGIFSPEQMEKLKVISDVDLRHTDTHFGPKSLSDDRGYIPTNTPLGQLARDIIQPHGRADLDNWRMLWRLGQAGLPRRRGINKKDKGPINQEAIDDRYARRYARGQVGTYGPRLPPVQLGPQIMSSTGADDTQTTSGSEAMIADWYLENMFPNWKGLLE